MHGSPVPTRNGQVFSCGFLYCSEASPIKQKVVKMGENMAPAGHLLGRLFLDASPGGSNNNSSSSGDVWSQLPRRVSERRVHQKKDQQNVEKSCLNVSFFSRFDVDMLVVSCCLDSVGECESRWWFGT
jgi:hypothetical protein